MELESMSSQDDDRTSIHMYGKMRGLFFTYVRVTITK